ncbi:cerebellin-3-like [Lingula anatina]|uniref:Cerebellin-3-like n=1 Tax=Lingula anatina TaxID=7574 RepID=A0A1S3H595_LINAN|nr:cerebellin-3-like [Lingula anatina]|eukprot:XP_013381137.1 cerebellin-3-like [Lingula anatina]
MMYEVQAAICIVCLVLSGYGKGQCAGSDQVSCTCSCPSVTPKVVAFSVMRTTPMGPLNADTIISFDRILSNTGSGFNQQTSKFTAPLSGTYVLSMSVSSTNNGLSWVRMYKNTENLVSVHAYGKPYAMASNQVIVPLMEGDTVWLDLAATSAIFGQGGPRIYNTFSGFKL